MVSGDITKDGKSKTKADPCRACSLSGTWQKQVEEESVKVDLRMEDALGRCK